MDQYRIPFGPLHEQYALYLLLLYHADSFNEDLETNINSN